MAYEQLRTFYDNVSGTGKEETITKWSHIFYYIANCLWKAVRVTWLRAFQDFFYLSQHTPPVVWLFLFMTEFVWMGTIDSGPLTAVEGNWTRAGGNSMIIFTSTLWVPHLTDVRSLFFLSVALCGAWELLGVLEWIMCSHSRGRFMEYAWCMLHMRNWDF